MYEPIRLQKLSLNQSKNLVKGKGVRVRFDPTSSFTISLSPAQIKKLSKAHRSGKAMTLNLDPYQQQITGRGIFGSKFDKWAKKTFGEKIYHGVEKIGKPILKKAITMGTAALAPYVSPVVAQRLGAVANAYVEDPSKYNEGPPKQALMNLAKTAAFGSGIFGSKADRAVKRIVGQKGMDIIEKTGRPLASRGIKKVSSMLRSAGVPGGVADRFEDVAEAYVDDPSAYQSKAGLMRLGKRAVTGNGIFGSKVDRAVKRIVGQKGMDIIEKTGRPLASRGIKKVSSMLRSAGVPGGVADRFEDVAEAYVDDPTAYQSKAGLMRLGKRAVSGGALYPPGFSGRGMYPPGVY